MSNYSGISRRDFLKLLGAGSTILALGGLRGITDLFNPGSKEKFPFGSQPYKQLASAQQGSWSAGANTTVTPIHAALLHTGKIFYLAGSGWNVSNQGPPFQARVLDINTGSEKVLEQDQDDLFCVGQTTLPDGTLLLAGGTLMYDVNPDNCNGQWHGLNAAYEFNVSTEELVPVSRMAHGRWYPTLVTLPDGKVWCYNGYDEYGDINRITEVYDPTSKSWTIVPAAGSTLQYCVGATSQSTCPGAGSPCYTGAGPTTSTYPRAHLMPSGLVVMNGFRTEIRSWRQSDGRWGSLGSTSTYRHYGTSFLLPLQNTTAERGKIMVVGGSPTTADYAVTTVQIIDFNASTTATPVVRTVSPLTYRRKYLTPVILPNGKLVVFGGSERGVSPPVLVPEMFDPVTETWQTLPPASWARVYHQVSLLLPDGRVWVAGGMPVNGVWEARTEFFRPDYISAANRPTISGSPTVGVYGGTIRIPTPNAAAVNSVSLVRLMNTTHHYDPNQRLVWLQITSRDASSVTVSAPINANIAPPGYYMIHVLTNGIPSAASIIRIPGTAQAPADTTAPSLAITSPANNSTHPAGTVTVSGTASDNVGVRDVRVRVDTNAYQTATTTNAWANWTINLSITTGGSHTITANARDAAGNFVTRGITINIGTAPTQDTTQPNIAITSPAANSTVSSPITVTGTASDNVGVRDVRVRLDNGVYRTATTTNAWANWTISVTSPTGSHNIVANARDAAGNFRLAAVSVNVT